jgi:hypothetical protein
VFRRTTSFASRETRRMQAGSPTVRSYPSKVSPRRQPYRIAAAVALLPFVASSVAGSGFAPSRSLGISRHRETDHRHRPGHFLPGRRRSAPEGAQSGRRRHAGCPSRLRSSVLDRSEPPVARRPDPPVWCFRPDRPAPRQRDRSRLHPARPRLPTEAGGVAADCRALLHRRVRAHRPPLPAVGARSFHGLCSLSRPRVSRSLVLPVSRGSDPAADRAEPSRRLPDGPTRRSAASVRARSPRPSPIAWPP